MNKGDKETFVALTDAVLGFPRAIGRIPDVIESPIKVRLIEAEFAYHQGKQPGVEERDVVELVNFLAHRLNLPTRATTSLKQVRILRMQLVVASPEFMAQGLTHERMAVGESVNSTMSPLQAFHLLNSLLDQKIINPNFQAEPAEWEKTQALSLGAKVPAKSELRGQRKNRELQDALLQAGSKLSVIQGMELIDHAFTSLKIKY